MFGYYVWRCATMPFLAAWWLVVGSWRRTVAKYTGLVNPIAAETIRRQEVEIVRLRSSLSVSEKETALAVSVNARNQARVERETAIEILLAQRGVHAAQIAGNRND